jgi:BspA type Leucine rich repeat region (6 copies)
VAAQGVKIACQYETGQLWQIPNTYYCKATVVDDGERNITGLIGFHLSGKSNADVAGFYIPSASAAIKYFPRGISAFFQNLRTINMYNLNIEEITSDDLDGLQKLEEIYFPNNKIKTIESNLFSSNPALQYIHFANNPISNVGDGAFGNLKDLKQLFFYQTSCITDSYTSNEEKNIPTMIQKIKTKCPPTTEMTVAKILKMELKSLNTQNQTQQNEFERRVNGQLEAQKAVISQLNATLQSSMELNKQQLSRIESRFESELKSNSTNKVNAQWEAQQAINAQLFATQRLVGDNLKTAAETLQSSIELNKQQQSRIESELRSDFWNATVNERYETAIRQLNVMNVRFEKIISKMENLQ